MGVSGSTEVAIVGAGPAGLAAASLLQRARIETRLLERAPAAGESWRRAYDRLTLHTVRSLSALPGLPIPRSCGRWVGRADFLRYLEAYAARLQPGPECGISVDAITPVSAGWTLRTTGGALSAKQVIVATGASRVPFVPAWPGLERFAGEWIHASAYRNAAPYRDRDVLVVGTGNTGAEIAADLAEGGASRVRVAVRTPPNIMSREVLGVPAQLMGVALGRLPERVVDPLANIFQRLTIGNTRAFGLPSPAGGLFHRAAFEDHVATIDTGFIAQVRRRRVACVASVSGCDGRDVVLADGSRITPDAMIVATGYRPALEPLVGHLGVLRDDGRPVCHGAACARQAPGLYFLGFVTDVGGVLRRIGRDAAAIARAITANGHSQRRELRG